MKKVRLIFALLVLAFSVLVYCTPDAVNDDTETAIDDGEIGDDDI